MILNILFAITGVKDCDILFIPIQLSVMFALRILDKKFVRHLRVACSHT